jgi:hypothetical protein
MKHISESKTDNILGLHPVTWEAKINNVRYIIDADKNPISENYIYKAWKLDSGTTYMLTITAEWIKITPTEDNMFHSFEDAVYALRLAIFNEEN